MFDLIKANQESLDVMIFVTKEYYDNIEICDKNYLEWQYFKNPVGNAYIRLAYSNDEPAGQYIIIPMKMKIGECMVKCTLSLNTLTREKFRGKKVFTILAEKVYEDCKNDNAKFTYGFPNQNSYPGFIKKLEFKNIGELPLLIRPINLYSILKKKTNSNIISSFLKPINLIFNVKNKKVNFISINKDNFYLFDSFWEKVKDKYSIIGMRNSEYIYWRYISIPIREYDILGILANNELVGYVVLRKTEIENFDIGMIVDFLFIQGYEKKALDLINQSIFKFKKDGMDMVGCLMNDNTEEYKILKKNKFFKVPKNLQPQPFPVILRNHDEDFIISENIEDWFLTMGDYDVI